MSANVTFLPGSRYTAQDRRNDFDVTNLVRVSSVTEVRNAVYEIFQDLYPNASFDLLWMAFHDFGRLYAGRMNGYAGCDTVYHDMQHSLDVTLAAARLVAGYEKSSSDADRLGEDRAILGMICALFHDAGYVRRSTENSWVNGAQFTLWHVSRSADFIADYLQQHGRGDQAELATELVHFTGYEKDLDDIELEDPKDSQMGHFLGTADLMAQIADRCYLEKCRDRLYSEFVLGGIAIRPQAPGNPAVLYESGIDLLRKTPMFFAENAQSRLEGKFNRAYRYVEALYDGRNPYLEFIDGNMNYLRYLVETGEWSALRRTPPVFTAIDDPLQSVSAMVSRRLSKMNAPASALTRP